MCIASSTSVLLSSDTTVCEVILTAHIVSLLICIWSVACVGLGCALNVIIVIYTVGSVCCVSNSLSFHFFFISHRVLYDYVLVFSVPSALTCDVL